MGIFINPFFYEVSMKILLRDFSPSIETLVISGFRNLSILRKANHLAHLAQAPNFHTMTLKFFPRARAS